MARPQFSLRALLIAVSAVGPSLIVGRWLLHLSGFGVLFIAFVSASLAAIFSSQAALLKVVARVRKPRC